MPDISPQLYELRSLYPKKKGHAYKEDTRKENIYEEDVNKSLSAANFPLGTEPYYVGSKRKSLDSYKPHDKKPRIINPGYTQTGNSLSGGGGLSSSSSKGDYNNSNPFSSSMPGLFSPISQNTSIFSQVPKQPAAPKSLSDDKEYDSEEFMKDLPTYY
ncbi:uncharacterized protein RSE6_14892 [Rhynchosporium secalis]|uniref:Uncharacterized protein n=1 Tax=Rhynchosporium secalis TaxID=38038 RepID=A0A1E1MWD3_RHYSE|nr:uncharacterized protein RSE6_14892 [Rhynchosporium secalis]